MAVRFSSSDRTRKLVLMAVLTALVVVLSFIKIPLGPFTVTLTLPVIIIGTALFGIWAGAWLGCVFGIMVFVTGDAAAFLAVNIPATILVVMLKGIAAGFLAGVVFKALQKKNKTLASVAAGVTAPVVNTGIFLLGCALFFYPTVKEWGLGSGYESGVAYMFLGLAGANFLIELALNLVLAPVIVRIIDLVVHKKYAQ